MTDRIRDSFETWAQKQGFTDLTHNLGRYNRAVVRWMWEAWQAQNERVPLRIVVASPTVLAHRQGRPGLEQAVDRAREPDAT